jgi:DNA-binding NarL/FixJ family response regulator
MRFPQIVVSGPDDWVANQLAELAADHRWLIRSVRRPAAALEPVREPRPTVLLVQADPTSEDIASLELVADAHRFVPDVPIVVISDVKVPESDRAGWVAAVLDLGARAVMFPPLSRPVLEDVVGGLMAATIRRTMAEVP